MAQEPASLPRPRENFTLLCMRCGSSLYYMREDRAPAASNIATTAGGADNDKRRGATAGSQVLMPASLRSTLVFGELRKGDVCIDLAPAFARHVFVERALREEREEMEVQCAPDRIG